MGELRLYAIGIAELRSIRGARGEAAEELRAAARRAFASPRPTERGLIAKLGPIFRRVPATPVISPTLPEPRDVEVLLAGGYVPPDRMGATWRLLEALVHARSWGATRMELTSRSLDDLDFALARGGVSSAVGLRHLLGCPTDVNLLPVPGLTVGWHRHEQAIAMAAAYRAALQEIETEQQRALVSGLVTWLDGFIPWSRVAADLHRPIPDLVGFWAQ